MEHIEKTEINNIENVGYLKQKKKKSRKAFWLILLLLVAAAAGLLFYQKKKAEAEAIDPNARENVVLEEDQSWLYLKIESIIGNEITAVETTAPRRMEMPPQDGQPPQGEPPAQDGQPAQGEQPPAQGEQPPQDEQPPQGELPAQGEQPPQGAQSAQRESAATADGELTGEAKTYMIPVGTAVVTKLGSETTFSRLAAGDTICCLIEEADGEPVILKIWIEE